MNERLQKLGAAFYVSFLLLTGCNGSNQDSIQVGTKPFQFDPRQVTELEIAKSDPETGDRWLAVLKQRQKAWEVSSAPHDQPLLDPRADETFIFHLLDTLQGIRVSAVAPRGPLESFGLNPPRFAIRWKTPKQGMEFRLGSKLKDGSGNYFTLDGENVFVVSGAAMKLLGVVDSFKALRKRSWASMSSDDVDEIELRRRGKLFLYAQREGDRWTDKNHRMIKQDIHSLLNAITTAESEGFVDDSTQVEQLKRFVHTDSLFEVSLIDRRGNTTSLKMKPKKDHLYGSNSSRPSAVFLLNPKLVQLFEKVKR